MRFLATELTGACLIVPERVEDERGYFVRTWCHDEFRRNIGDVSFVQASQSFNRAAGTLRGGIRGGSLALCVPIRTAPAPTSSTDPTTSTGA